MWIVEHLGRRYIGPFGAEMVDEPSDVGVSHNEGPLLSALNLQVGADMHLRYDMGSTTHVRLVCKGVGAAEAGEALPSAKWRGGSAAAVPEPAQDWAREMYPAVFAFLTQDGGILDVGLGNSFDKICELTACNCGGNLELDQHVSEAPDGLAQALGRLDAELRSCDILSQDFYAQLPAAKQMPWPKHFPRVNKFISKRPQGKHRESIYIQVSSFRDAHGPPAARLPHCRAATRIGRLRRGDARQPALPLQQAPRGVLSQAAGALAVPRAGAAGGRPG